METNRCGDGIDDSICLREIGNLSSLDALEIHCLHQLGSQVHGNCCAFIKHHRHTCQKPSHNSMQLIIQVPDPAEETTCALVYTNKRSKESTQLEVFFVVEEREEPGWLCKQVPECRGDPETALDQVAHAEHPDEAFNTVGDAVVFIMLAASVPWSMLAYGVHETPNQSN